MPRYVLDGIVKYAAPELKPTLLAKANMETTTPLLEAEKMANFAQPMTVEERPARALGRNVNAIEEASISAVEALVCNYCKVLSFFGFLTKSATAFDVGIELKLLNSRTERIKSISLCESDALYAKLYAEVLKKLRGGDIPSREEAICYGTIYTWIREL
jgi:hypothetical protein